MKEYPFKKIDAFATATSSGNPAGVISLSTPTDISEQDMQRIARELKGFVSEVGYLWQNDDDTYGLRYFSSEREVEFCGHATIAIMHDLIKNNNRLINKEAISIVNNKGRLEVENRIPNENSVFITAPDPVFVSAAIDKNRFAEAMKIEPGAISDDYPVSVVNAGLETLIVPIKTLDTVLSLAPRLDELKSYCRINSVDIITVFTDETAHKPNRFRTRVFAPTFGYLEDPATGSGNAAFGYYLLKNGTWDGKPMTLEQNGDFVNPNIVKLITRKAENKIRVLFGGGAVVRIQGKYILS